MKEAARKSGLVYPSLLRVLPTPAAFPAVAEQAEGSCGEEEESAGFGDGSCLYLFKSDIVGIETDRANVYGHVGQDITQPPHSVRILKP